MPLPSTTIKKRREKEFHEDTAHGGTQKLKEMVC
jgi:hypothetical protein